jgi:hypothetical protein
MTNKRFLDFEEFWKSNIEEIELREKYEEISSLSTIHSFRTHM